MKPRAEMKIVTRFDPVEIIRLSHVSVICNLFILIISGWHQVLSWPTKDPQKPSRLVRALKLSGKLEGFMAINN